MVYFEDGVAIVRVFPESKSYSSLIRNHTPHENVERPYIDSNWTNYYDFFTSDYRLDIFSVHKILLVTRNAQNGGLLKQL